MKLYKTLTVAAIMAASSSVLASASTYTVHITGSTAFRAATENAIANLYTSGDMATYAASNGSATTIDKADFVTFTGAFGTDTYNIYVDWSGSEAGIAATAQNNGTFPTIPFLTETANSFSTVTAGVAPAVLTGGTQVGLASGGTSATYENDRADVTLSDGWQASTPFHGTVNGTTYGGLGGTTVPGISSATVVGVVPFKFVANVMDSNGTSYAPKSTTEGLSTTAGSTTATLDTADAALKSGELVSGTSAVPASTSVVSVSADNTTVTLSNPASVTTDANVTFNYTGISNMTDILARKTFESAGGTVAKLSQFTGSNADAGLSVIAVGRNHDSGTRNAMVLNTAIDKPGTAVTAIQQYYPLDIDGNVVGNGSGPDNAIIASDELVPAETINGFNYSVGQSGYGSGGHLAKVFTASNQLSNTLFVGYLGTNDAKTALTGNAIELSYNGIYYSSTAVDQGQYTFWSYEHLYYLSGLGPKAKAYANDLAVQLAKHDVIISGVSMTDGNFKATRIPNTTDGAIVTR